MAARTAVDYASWVQNGVCVEPAGVSLDPTNGHITALPRASSPGSADSADGLLYFVENTDTADHTITIKAGVSSLASFRGGTGDLTVTIPLSGAGYIGPLENIRFAQGDGSIHVDVEAGTTGSIWAYMLPNRW